MALYMDSYTNVKITVSVCIKSKKKASITSSTVRKHMYTVHLIKSWENVLPMLIAFYYKSLSHSLNELRFPIKCRK